MNEKVIEAKSFLIKFHEVLITIISITIVIKIFEFEQFFYLNRSSGIYLMIVLSIIF